MVKEKYISRIKETSISVVQTKIDSIRKKDITRTGIRVYDNGFIGTAGAIGSYNEEDLDKKAIENLKNNVPYPYEVSKNKKLKLDYKTEIIGENEIVNEFDEVLKQLREDQPDFIFSHKIDITEYEYELKNDQGLDIRYRDKAVEIGLLFKEKTSVNIMDGFVAIEGRKYNRDEFLLGANQICNAFKNKVELPNKERLPVVFSSSEYLPSLKLIQDLDGNAYGSNRSLFANKIGEKVFSEKFTLYQTHNPEDGIGPFFDAEGVVNEDYRYTLIKEGKLIAPYSDKKVSKLYNLPLTGSAVAAYDGVPRLGAPRLKIMESEKTAKELLNGEMGIFVIIASGGDFTPDGSFATPVQLAMLFDGEKFIGRLPELKISSNVFEMFGDDFIGVSRDSYLPLSDEKCMIMELNVSKM